MDEPLRALSRERRERPRVWRRRARLLVLFVASLLVVNALVGERSVLGLVRVERDRLALEQEIATLRLENARLREEARRLREDPEAIEAAARQELGLISRGERVVLTRPGRPAAR